MNTINTTALTLYTANGTLVANRTVDQGANTLNFNSTADNAFAVDGTTFNVDADTNRVGVGTNAPTSELDVNGTARIRNLPTGVNTDNIVSVDANGNLKRVDEMTLRELAGVRSTETTFFSTSTGATSLDGPLISITATDFLPQIIKTSNTTFDVQITNLATGGVAGFYYAVEKPWDSPTYDQGREVLGPSGVFTIASGVTFGADISRLIRVQLSTNNTNPRWFEITFIVFAAETSSSPNLSSGVFISVEQIK